MDDPDAIWKPGYDGPAPTVTLAPEQLDEETTGDSPNDAPVPAGRSRRRWVAGGVAVGLALVAGLVALVGSDSGDDAPSAVPTIAVPDPSVFGGTAARRLPQTAAPLWTVDLADTGDHRVDVIGRDLVVVATGTDASAAPLTALVAFDALTGEQRWTTEVPALLGDVTVIGALGDVVVLELPGSSGRTIEGIDPATGETLWSTGDVANDGHVGLVGTSLIARLPVPPDQLVTLIDARSGREVGTIVSDAASSGRPGGWFTDGRGTWYVADSGEVVRYDLMSGLDEVASFGPVGDETVTPIAVGDRLAVVDDSGAIAFVGASESGSVTVSTDVPTGVTSLTPVSESSFVVTAPATIAGVAVEGDMAVVAWSRDQGALVGWQPVAGGTLLQVATRGGAGMELVDGRTGDTLEQLTMSPGALQALVVAGDGLVVLRSAPLGTKLSGIDLDGTERWSILGPEPVVVGDRVMVRATPDRGRLRLTAYGDIDDSPG